MRMKAIITFSLCLAFTTISYAKPIIQIESSDLFNKNVKKYRGKTFIYYDLAYTKDFSPPFPYQGGRIKSGKYKSSETAMNNYIKSLASYREKRFTFIDSAFDETGNIGILMANEKDTLFFEAKGIDGRFVSEEFFNNEKKKINSKIYYLNTISQSPEIDTIEFNHDLIEYFRGFKNTKNNEIILYMPFFSEWKLKNVTYDTTYSGESFYRIKYTIENPTFGTFECLPYNMPKGFSENINTYTYEDIDLSFSRADLVFIKKWAEKKNTEAIYIQSAIEISRGHDEEKNFNIIIECAQKGYLPAVYDVITSFRFLRIRTKKGIELINAAVNKYGYIKSLGQILIEKIAPFVDRQDRANFTERQYDQIMFEIHTLAKKCGYPDGYAPSNPMLPAWQQKRLQ